MTTPVLTDGPLDAGAVLHAVRDPAHGATTLFVGTTRIEGEGGDAVVALAYDAYGPMAESVAAVLVDEVAMRFGARLAVAHRLGEVPAGEASIVVAASAPHRAEAFAACRFAVDALKRDLPVWKQEIRADGTRRWRDGVAPAIPSAP
jgi:molybdopterin synthase catalytic subunit